MNYVDFVVQIKSDLTTTSTFQGHEKHSRLELSNDIKEFKDELATPEKRFTIDQVKDFGEHLRKALFRDDIEKQFKDAMGFVKNRNDELGIRILLDIVPPFADYPWEAMSYEQNFWATDIRTPIVRIFDGNNKGINLKDKLPTILVILSNATGQYYVNTAQEWEIIQKSLAQNKSITPPKKVDIATKTRILDAIDEGEGEDKGIFNIIHFVGHGKFKDGKCFLALQTEEGRLDEADEDVISALFQNIRSLGLVILNACSTATISSDFNGLVPKLLKRVPAVIAMRQPISNVAAKEFTAGIYSNLFSQSIEEAIQKARNNMYIKQANPIDFSIPVLYLGISDNKTASKIFDKKYQSEEVLLPISGQKDPDEIIDRLRQLDRVYLDFEKMVDNILIADPTELVWYSRNAFIWSPALKELRKNCEKTIKDVCLVFPTANDTLSEKHASLISKLTDLSNSIKNGIMGNIERSWEEVKKEYDLLSKSCAHLLIHMPEDN